MPGGRDEKMDEPYLEAASQYCQGLVEVVLVSNRVKLNVPRGTAYSARECAQCLLDKVI